MSSVMINNNSSSNSSNIDIAVETNKTVIYVKKSIAAAAEDAYN